ncbi:MAG: ArnT family glycosyltransferase [Isosphaeraceae bacterium]
MIRGRKLGASPSALAAVLMGVHASLLLVGMRYNFVTYDDAAHIPAGISHWETGDFTLYRANPPLYRMLAALPVMLSRPYTTYTHADHKPGARSEFLIGHDFAEANASKYFDLVCLARLPGVAWSLLGAWIIYLWCRDLYGGWAGCLGVAIWALDPTVLAFAGVVTSDVPAAVAGLAATYVFWRYLRSGSWQLGLWSGVLLGVALLTKFTMLVLYAAWPLIALLHFLGRRSGGSRVEGGNRSTTGASDTAASAWAILILSLCVINLGYFCRDTCHRLGDFPFVSNALAGPPSVSEPAPWGNRFRGTWMGSLIVPVPADYLLGIDVQKKDFEVGMPAYLAGEWRDRGWWYYYIYALTVKEPLGTLALVLWALALTLTRHPGSARWWDEATLFVPAAAVFILVSSQTGINQHMRYILPFFPFVAVATGKLAHFLSPGHRLARVLVIGLLVWSAFSSMRVFPHSLSYFNEAAGGLERGHDHLVDSNIDWGQDLLALRDWYRQHPEARPFGLAIFHSIDPRIFGIDYRLPPLGPDMRDSDENGTDEPDDTAQLGPQPGYYAVSVNLLRGTKISVSTGRGGWTYIGNHDSFTYFQYYRPIARAGYSIYIYHITPEEAERVRRMMAETRQRLAHSPKNTR